MKKASDWIPDDWTWIVDSAIFIIGFLTRILPSVYIGCKYYFRNKKLIIEQEYLTASLKKCNTCFKIKPFLDF